MKEKIKLEVTEMTPNQFQGFCHAVAEYYKNLTGRDASEDQMDFFKAYCLRMSPHIEFTSEE